MSKGLLIAIVFSPVLIIAFPVLGNANASPDSFGNFYQEKPIKELLFPKKLNGSDIRKIDVANVGYKNSKGIYDTVHDLYVTAYYEGGQPQIIGYVEGGFEPELYAKDLDGSGIDEILLHYHVGAHTSEYKIYQITYDGSDEIKEIPSDDISSNLDSITLNFNSRQNRYEFEVKNITQLPYSEAPPPNVKFKLTTSTYALVTGKIKLLTESSQIVSQ